MAGGAAVEEFEVPCGSVSRFRPIGMGFAVLAALWLGGCAAPKYTVDDGRPVNEELLAQIRTYGRTERALRPAIVRSAELKDPQCAKQWELPFSVASSQAWKEDDRVAWVRGLNVDERLTVIGASLQGPLKLGDRIVAVKGKKFKDTVELTERLSEVRDDGQPFKVTLSDGRDVTVTPIEVCRGYARLAPPNTPSAQDYHWLMSVHPLEIGQVEFSEDEALWAVLWTQGLSEEGGLRMKTYHYGSKVVGTLYNVFTIATGLRGAAMAAQAAAEVAQSAAASAATELVKQQLIKQAQDLAQAKLHDTLVDTAQRMAQQQAVSAMQQAAANRGSLGGVARIGATVFDWADRWAFERAPTLSANPLAGFTLHQKLVETGRASNAFVFDAERLQALTDTAQGRGLGSAVVAALNGLKPASLTADIQAMPLASAERGFSYEDALAGDTANPYAQGLVAATLTLPVESQR